MSSRSKVSGVIEERCDLTVIPTLFSEGQDSVNQVLLVSTQRTNVEDDRSTADNEVL